jgi:hypothetical protein
MKTETASDAGYGIEKHKHLFAAWAASRAASVKGCRFSVEQGRAILEGIGFRKGFSNPDHLPAPENFNSKHRQWRERAIKKAKKLHKLKLKHGVAAKLINCYLKSRFVCGGHHDHPRVHNLHPPIDALLLEALKEGNVGKCAEHWKKACKKRWSKFDSENYEEVIAQTRSCLPKKPLWVIEEYWRGNQ